MHCSQTSSQARRLRASALAAASFLLALGGVAQAATLETVVVTGARGEQAFDEALAPVTLITRADIERAQATDLIELVARLSPAVQFVRSGGPGTAASLFVRGAGSSQLLVLVDGMRINTPLTGGAVLGGIALDAVERIEIVRGNLSSLYGSEAIGGVVQIFTRGAVAERELSASLEAGSGATRSGAVSATGSVGGTRISATVAARAAEPFSAIDTARVQVSPFAAGANPDHDAHRQRSGALRATHRLSDATTVGVSAWSRRSRTEFDDTADGPTATHEEDARSESWQANLRHALAEIWTVDLRLGEASETSDNRASVPASWSAGRFESRNRSAQVQLEARLAPRVAAQVGLEYLHQRGAASGYDPAFGGALTGFGRHVGSAWFGVTGRTDDGRRSVQLSARHDDISDVGRHDTWLVAYGIALAPRLRATAQASTAFRAPSFNDLHFPGLGNPNLRPETAASLELGLRYAQAGTRASVAVFRTHTRDLIQFGGARMDNVARARTDGVELTAGQVLGAWRLEANATYLDARDEASGERLLRRAPWSAQLGLFHERSRWLLGTELAWVDARSDFDINTFARKLLPAHTLVRALAHYRASANLRLKLRLENLFDERYTLVDGYSTWGRALFGGIEWRQ